MYVLSEMSESEINYCSFCTHKVVDAISKCLTCNLSYHNSCASRCLTATDGSFSCCFQPLAGHINIQRKRKSKMALDESENHLAKVTKKTENIVNYANNHLSEKNNGIIDESAIHNISSVSEKDSNINNHIDKDSMYLTSSGDSPLSSNTIIPSSHSHLQTNTQNSLSITPMIMKYIIIIHIKKIITPQIQR